MDSEREQNGLALGGRATYEVRECKSASVCTDHIRFAHVAQPNGRFELNKKICLSISSYHPENWKPTWGSMVQGTALHFWFGGDCFIGVVF